MAAATRFGSGRLGGAAASYGVSFATARSHQLARGYSGVARRKAREVFLNSKWPPLLDSDRAAWAVQRPATGSASPRPDRTSWPGVKVFVNEWRRPCGRRPLSTTTFSTSTRCCIPGPSSINRGTCWSTPIGFRETRHPGVLCIRCIGDCVLSRSAGTRGPQGSRHHRRDPRSLMRPRRRPQPSAGR